MSSVKKIIDWYVKKGVASNPITYQTGRIKRMRGITDNRWSRMFRRIGLKRYILILNMNDDLFEKTMFGITRWNRH